MRAEVYVKATRFDVRPGFVVTFEVLDYLGGPHVHYVEGLRVAGIVTDALQRELHHTTWSTGGALVRFVSRRMLGLRGSEVVILDVVEAARLLDRHGVAVPA